MVVTMNFRDVGSKPVWMSVLGALAISWGAVAWGQAVPLYQIYVKTSDLERVQAQVPDAILVEGDDGIFVLAGSFGTESNAQRRLAELEQGGFSAQLVLRQPGDPVPVAVASSGETASTSESTETSQPVTSSDPAPAPVPAVPAPVAANPSPGESLGPEFDPSRPFQVLVPNPTQDPELSAQVRRFFPTAQDVIYQQQPAMQTGSFSQLGLAQEQSRWLTNQGLAAVAVPSLDADPVGDPVAVGDLAPSTSESTAPSSSDTSSGDDVWVLVADPDGEKLGAIQAAFAGAVPLRFDGIQAIKVGGFRTVDDAQTQVEQLAQMGYEAGAFPADLSRTEPILGSGGGAATGIPADAEIPADAPVDPNIGFLVLVPADQGTLEQVQGQVPDAFIRRYQEQTVVQVGSYRLRSSAVAAVQTLAELGLSGQIIELGEALGSQAAN